MNLLHSAIISSLPLVPRSLFRRIAGRYIAGETREGLLRVVRKLHEEGLRTTVDVLGENVTSPEQAQHAADEYRRVIQEIASAGGSPQVSVKLSLLGLRLDEKLALDHLLEITRAATLSGVGVFLDMEDTSTTDATLRIYRRAHQEFQGLGIAVQAYLHRSVRDVLELLPLRPAIRICKGIYNEPATLALKDRRAIQENYLKIVTLLVDGDGFPAMATHDAWLVDQCQELLRSRSVGPGSHEFQMLLGVGEGLRSRIRKAGSPLRLYCPYGPDWEAYSVRRLKENPHMAGYIFKSVLSRRILDRGHLDP